MLSSVQETIDERAQAFYRHALRNLNEAEVDYLVGGAYALARHTGVARHTKDIDIFVRERDLERVLSVLEMNGCCTEITYPHWLGKARCGEELMDVIYGSGNGVVMVDDEWFEHALLMDAVARGVRIVRAVRALQVDGLGLAALVLLEVIADLLVLVQRAHARLLDGGDVDERVLAAIIRLDEAKALGFVEKFHGAYWHSLIPSCWRTDCRSPGARSSEEKE